ncbi:myosin heavy chain, clone 203-like [Macrobrachium rosenbergii]|uniref:myosin heavy chain, clone 203-like n=1 Tax=Macrobrachium rosenbergii TaxID=79674 RepID=UPI0034D5DFCA
MSCFVSLAYNFVGFVFGLIFVIIKPFTGYFFARPKEDRGTLEEEMALGNRNVVIFQEKISDQKNHIQSLELEDVLASRDTSIQSLNDAVVPLMKLVTHQEDQDRIDARKMVADLKAQRKSLGHNKDCVNMRAHLDVHIHLLTKARGKNIKSEMEKIRKCACQKRVGTEQLLPTLENSLPTALPEKTDIIPHCAPEKLIPTEEASKEVITTMEDDLTTNQRETQKSTPDDAFPECEETCFQEEDEVITSLERSSTSPNLPAFDEPAMLFNVEDFLFTIDDLLSPISSSEELAITGDTFCNPKISNAILEYDISINPKISFNVDNIIFKSDVATAPEESLEAGISITSEEVKPEELITTSHDIAADDVIIPKEVFDVPAYFSLSPQVFPVVQEEAFTAEESVDHIKKRDASTEETEAFYRERDNFPIERKKLDEEKEIFLAERQDLLKEKQKLNEEIEDFHKDRRNFLNIKEIHEQRQASFFKRLEATVTALEKREKKLESELIVLQQEKDELQKKERHLNLLEETLCQKEKEQFCGQKEESNRMRIQELEREILQLKAKLTFKNKMLEKSNTKNLDLLKIIMKSNVINSAELDAHLADIGEILGI